MSTIKLWFLEMLLSIKGTATLHYQNDFKLGYKKRISVWLPWVQQAACERWRHSVWPEEGWSSNSQSSTVCEVQCPRWACHGGFHPTSPALDKDKNDQFCGEPLTTINNDAETKTHQHLSVHIQRNWAAWAATSPQLWQWSDELSPSGAAYISWLHL